MMKVNLNGTRSKATGGLSLHQATRLRSRVGGALRVEAGQVWLTRDGGIDDHVLGRGESIRLAAGEAAVVEPWRAGVEARLSWRADQPPRRRLGLVLGGLALAVMRFFVGAAGWRWPAALARSAEASAILAHGSIACGESNASSGALQ